MTNIFTVKLLKNGQLIQQRQVHTGLAESTGAVRIKALADTVYVLSSETSKKSVSKIATQRIGTDLHVVLDDSTNGKPQLIIEGYFEPNQNSALATQGSEGELVLFRAQSQPPMQATAESNPVVVQTADGADITWWNSPGIQLTMIGTGLVLVAANKNKSNTTDTSQSAKDTLTTFASATDPTKVATPTLSNYADAGFKGVDTSNLDAINSAINRAHVKDLAGVQAVLSAYQKLFAKANGSAADNTNDDPSLADYQTLGIKLSAETIANNNHQIDLLNDIIKNRTSIDINNVTKLDVFASISDRVVFNAKENKPPATQLTTAELKSIGLTDVTDVNLASIISAIAASVDDGTGVQSINQLTNIQAAYIKVLTEADGVKLNTTDATKIPTAAELLTLGVTLGKAGTLADAQQASALKLLNDVIDGLNNAAVDTVAEISALAITIDKVMNVSIAANTTNAITVGLMASELTALGLSGVTIDNLAQVVEAIRLTQSSDGSKVNTFKQMQSAIDLGVIMQYAESLPSASTGHVAPSLSQYLSAGLTSLDVGTSKAINANNLSAINSAVEALQASNVNTLIKLQNVVNAYAKLLTMADGVKANSTDVLTKDEYSLLGALTTFDANTGAPGGAYTAKAADDNSTQKVASLTLLNDVINARISSQVDSIAEINSLSAAVDKVLDQANNTPTSTMKSSDFSLLGIQNVTDTNLAQVVADLHTAAGTQTDGHTIDTLAEIQSSVSLAIVQMYADNSNNNSNITPTLQIYKDLNFSDVSWDNALVTAVNTVIDSKNKSDINLPSLQGIANAFESILAEATNGVTNRNPDPTASIYETVTGSSNHIFSVNNTILPTLDDNALSLMNQIVQHKTPEQLNSLVKVELLANQVDQLMKLASNTGTITFTDLSSMGLSIPSGWSDYNTPNKINKFSQLVIASADSGEDINSWEKVQNIINSSAVISA